MGLRLDRLDDRQLVQNIQSGEWVNESLKELVDRHSGIYYSMVHSYAKTAPSTNMDLEHLMGSCEYTIHEAALRYDNSKSIKVSSFIGFWTRWSILNHIKQSRKLMPCEDVNSNSFEHDDAEDTDILSRIITDDMVDVILKEIRDKCDPRIYELFRLRYIDTGSNRVRPWKEVSQHIHSTRDPSKTITIQACIGLHDKTLEKIRNGLKLK